MNTHKYTNQLVHETSPYLLQHAHNPVNWFPWGNEALEKAKNENKLLIISIGYAACHWCHVMEHESFEDEEVAELMNNHFVSVKVDREERPDIDQIYMSAVQLLNQHGGWPLNCIALPDGRPIYGGTYFRKNQWMEVLTQIQEFNEKKPDKLEEQANLLTQGIRTSELIQTNNEITGFTISDLNEIFDNWKNHIDFEHGGHKGAPKFPLPVGLQFLMQYYHITKNTDALNAVNTTLSCMANGGIYDQVGGGFARYSVDMHWKVPHFEKMLYDNAQLVSVYSSAYQLTKNDYYKTIVDETLEFVKRELTTEDFSFYASLDADSEGEEGKYYVWTKDEIQNILGNDADLFIDYYNITENGNWEDKKNILLKTETDETILKRYKKSTKELNQLIANVKQKLLKYREKRIKPGLDNKILTAWNALMLKGYVDAYRVFNNNEYLEIAIKNAEFIINHLKTRDNKLYRNSRQSINGFLDDYAFTISAFIALYQATFNEKWLNHAYELTQYALSHFFNKTSGLFYYTSDIDPKLIARKIELMDNVIPSSNSEMAKNLFLLGHYFHIDDYVEKSKKMLSNVKDKAIKGHAYFANWSSLMGWFAAKPYEVVIAGDNCLDLRKEIDKYYLPNVILSGGKHEGNLPLLKNRFLKDQTTIYVCKDKVCKLPVTSVEAALQQLSL